MTSRFEPERPAPGRPLPDRTRGDVRDLSDLAARLAERAAEVDRRQRFHDRAAAVATERARTVRNERLVRGSVLAATTLAAVLLGSQIAGWLGAGIGLLAAPAGVLVDLGMQRLAQRRGASAWDWTAGRYRIMGSPADRVQQMDRPPGQRERSILS